MSTPLLAVAIYSAYGIGNRVSYIEIHETTLLHEKANFLYIYMNSHRSKVRDKFDNYTHKLILEFFHTIVRIDGISLTTDSVLLSLSGQGVEAFYLLPHQTTLASWSCRRLGFLVDGAVDMLSETVLWHYGNKQTQLKNKL